MQQIALSVKTREKSGKGASLKMRRGGIIPANVYGRKKKPLSIEVPEVELEKISRMSDARNAIINLNLDGKEGDISTLLKEVQRHPVTEKLLHVDFYRISMKDKITVSIPVKVTGESVGVKAGGILEHILWEIEIECLPTQIPGKISVDISSLDIGDTVHVRDLQVGEEIKILTDSNKTLLSVVPPTVVKEEVVEEEIEEGAEPERIGGEKEAGEEKEKAAEAPKPEKKEEGEKKEAPKKAPEK